MWRIMSSFGVYVWDWLYWWSSKNRWTTSCTGLDATTLNYTSCSTTEHTQQALLTTVATIITMISVIHSHPCAIDILRIGSGVHYIVSWISRKFNCWWGVIRFWLVHLKSTAIQHNLSAGRLTSVSRANTCSVIRACMCRSVGMLRNDSLVAEVEIPLALSATGRYNGLDTQITTDVTFARFWSPSFLIDVCGRNRSELYHAIGGCISYWPRGSPVNRVAFTPITMMPSGGTVLLSKYEWR